MSKQNLGGRPKGAMNRKSEALFELCDELGINPFAEMLKLSQESDDESIRLQAYKEMCQYLYPKRKALEVSGDDGGALRIIVEDYGIKSQGNSTPEGE